MIIGILAALFGFLVGWWLKPAQTIPDVVLVLRLAKQLEEEMKSRFPTIRVEGLGAYSKFLAGSPELRWAFSGFVQTRNRLVHKKGFEVLTPLYRQKVYKQIRILRQYGLLKGGV